MEPELSEIKLITPPPLSPVRGWVGVDWDGTLREYHGWVGPDHSGAPIPAMVEAVKAWLAQGIDVRIFTARVWEDGTDERKATARLARLHIVKECVAMFGQPLAVTCVKDYGMVALYDDRAVRVKTNTGEIMDDAPPRPS